jgi:predicted DNA-binding protein (UPF0251 family)
MKFVPWTKEEDEALRGLAMAGLGMSEIAERMQRSKSSVRVRSANLKIAIAREENPMQKGKLIFAHRNQRR